jgi:serine/threonine protein kinase
MAVRNSVAPLVPLETVRGTGAWMAPEMVTRQVEVTTKADVYSFGVVLWELVSPNVDLIGAWVSSTHSTTLDSRATVVTISSGENRFRVRRCI